MPRRRPAKEDGESSARHGSEAGGVSGGRGRAALVAALEKPLTREELAALQLANQVPLPVRVLAVGFRRLREALGWSQEALAQAAGVSRQLVSQVEKAEHSPAWMTTDKLCDGLGFGHWRLARWAKKIARKLGG